MFSGIVEALGSVQAVADSDEGRRLVISAPSFLAELTLGESVSISGCCMTVAAFEKDGFVIEASHETLNRTRLGALVTKDKVNLERALKLNDRLGGHLVSGHIDCVGEVVKIADDGFSKIIEFEMDRKWAPYFVEKGSVAVEGVSLTVASLSDSPAFRFSVALIPHTLAVTTLGELKTGSKVNIETDVIARYVARLLAPNMAFLATGTSNRLLEEAKEALSFLPNP
jgi:riboflavin synthase